MVPVWAQNLGISLYGLGWRRERFGGRFEEYVHAFRDRDTWPAPKFQNYLGVELRKVLRRALLEVPYYGQTWRAAGITAQNLAGFDVGDLERLPITPKNDLRAQ